MSGFKIIAIKTGRKLTETEKNNPDCFDYLRVLSPNTIYSLHNAYKVAEDGSKIEYIPKLNTDLYSIKLINKSISIAAIVGENGSGKSSLIELLFLAIYNISVKREYYT